MRRALQPGRHHLEFWASSRDDLFQLVPELNRRYAANASAFEGLSREAQRFASLYLSPRARLVYWRAALLAYRALLPDMDAYAAALVAELRAAGKLEGGGAAVQ